VKASPGLSREEIAARADLTGIPDVLRERAIDALSERNIVGFFLKADNLLSLDLLWRNRVLFESLGIFEAALLDAYQAPRTNCLHVPAARLRGLFARADRRRLREAGAPLPTGGPFTLFRGVAGNGPARRVRGLSWTSDRAVAEWFASRARLMGLKSPAVYRVVVPTRHVLAYITEREESEFLVLLPPSIRVEREAA